MTQEKQYRSGQLFHQGMGEFQTGLTNAEVNTTTAKEEMTKKKDVEDACNDEYRRKFSQTSNTPLIDGQID